MRYYFLILTFITVFFVGCNPITERLNNFAVHGVDVSHYQSTINWDKVSEDKINFAFVKATEGHEFSDSLFCYNWQELKRTSIKRGAYHFFRPTLSPKIQARNFLNQVELEKGDLPPVLDVEVLDGVSPKVLIEKMQIWLNMVEYTYNVQPIIYTNLKFYHQHLAGHFDDYAIWMARYNTEAPYLTGDKQWLFWQYGNRGKIEGIEGFVDLNVFHGTLQELDALGYEPPILYSNK